MSEMKCSLCGESFAGHRQPFSPIPRPCDEAKIYAKCPDPIFCRMPHWCSHVKKCHSQVAYEKACND